MDCMDVLIQKLRGDDQHAPREKINKGEADEMVSNHFDILRTYKKGKIRFFKIWPVEYTMYYCSKIMHLFAPFERFLSRFSTTTIFVGRYYVNSIWGITHTFSRIVSNMTLFYEGAWFHTFLRQLWQLYLSTQSNQKLCLEISFHNYLPLQI